MITKENLIYLGTILSLGVLWLLIQHEKWVHLSQNIALFAAIVGIIFFSMFYGKEKDSKLVATFLGLVSMALGFTWAYLESGLVEKTDANDLVLLATFVSVVLFIVYGFIKHYSVEFSRTVVLMILILSTIVFWALFEQSAGSMTLYADRVMDRVLYASPMGADDAWIFNTVGGVLAALALVLWFMSARWNSRSGGNLVALVAGAIAALILPLVASVVAFAFIFISTLYSRTEKKAFNHDEVNLTSGAHSAIAASLVALAGYCFYLGNQYGVLPTGETAMFSIEPTAGQYGSLNAMFIILLAAPFAAVWTSLDKRNMDPSTPVKFSLGILLAGAGFGVMVFGSDYINEVGKVSMIWLVLAYLLHTMGELCLSPVGLSAVTKLSISRVVGVSMGTWFLATALSETIATRLGKIAAVDTTQGEVSDVAGALARYTELFDFLFWVGVGVGVFMLVISPLLKKGMHGVK